jgi:DNA-binding response OmpR family regulator
MTTALPRPSLRIVRATDTPGRPSEVEQRRTLSNDELAVQLPSVLRGEADAGRLCNRALVVGDLSLDPTTGEVSRSGVRIELTGNEFEVLRYLMRHPEQALSREQIMANAWSYHFGGRSGVVDLYIHFLRKKIDAGRPPMIQTVDGSGYLLQPAY